MLLFLLTVSLYTHSVGKFAVDGMSASGEYLADAIKIDWTGGLYTYEES